MATLEPTTVVVITDNPNAGECFVIRPKEFESGVKYELKDMYGRTHHKTADELRVVKGPHKPKPSTKPRRKIQGELFN